MWAMFTGKIIDDDEKGSNLSETPHSPTSDVLSLIGTCLVSHNFTDQKIINYV